MTRKQVKISNKIHIIFPTTPYAHCCTTRKNKQSNLLQITEDTTLNGNGKCRFI